MRILTIVLLLLLTGCAHSIASSNNAGDEFVIGRLLSVRPAQVGCGVLSVGSEATYLVLEGPSNLNGREITVLVGCIELFRHRFSDDAGDLTEFVPGDVHYLAITKEDVHTLDVPELPAGELWFYLRAASLKPLRPNNSFKPKPLRGSA